MKYHTPGSWHSTKPPYVTPLGGVRGWCSLPISPIITLKIHASLGGLEPPTFRLTAERAIRLRHRDHLSFPENAEHYRMVCLFGLSNLKEFGATRLLI